MTEDTTARPQPHAGEMRTSVARTFAARANMPRVDRLAVALLALAAAIRLALMVKGWPAPSGDEAVIGLMGRHILYQHELPVFYWGQDYMGALEAYVAAGVFAVLGPSLFSLRLMALLLTLGFFAALYALGRAAYGRAAGVLALAWLAFGPSYALMREIQPIGGYQETLLLGALVLLGVWVRLRQPTPRPADTRAWRRCWLTYLGIGLAAGLGLWSDLLILPVLVVALATLLWARWDELRGRAGLVLALGFFLGALPFLVYNIVLPNATYIQVARMTHAPGTSSLLSAPLDLARQVGSTLAVALPIVLGSPHVCVTSGSVSTTYPPLLAQVTPGPSLACEAGNLALSGGYLLVLGGIAWQLLRAARGWAAAVLQQRDTKDEQRPRHASTFLRQQWDWVRRIVFALRRAHSDQLTRTRTPAEAEATARLWLRGMLLATVALTLAIYTSNFQARHYQFDTARYLLPVYLGAPLLTGALWAQARRLHAWAVRERSALRARGGRLSGDPRRPARHQILPLACGVGLTLALTFTLLSGIVTLAHASNTRLFGMPLPPGDRQVLAGLDRVGARAFYGDYGTCYRLAFEANERLACAVRGQGGPPSLALGTNRRWSYVLALRAEPHPAYVLPANTPEDRDFATEAAREGLPHDSYARIIAGPYAIYYYAGASARARPRP